MKSNYICMLGILPIGICGYIWKSYIMMICCGMGIVTHMYPDNKIIKYTDLTFNTYSSFKATTYGNNIMPLFIFSGTFYTLNSFVYDVNNHTRYIACNVAHVLFIQMVGIYGYYRLYKHEPCIEFYFDCEDNLINY